MPLESVNKARQRELVTDRVSRNICFSCALRAKTGGGTPLFLKWRGGEQEEADAVTKQVMLKKDLMCGVKLSGTTNTQ